MLLSPTPSRNLVLSPHWCLPHPRVCDLFVPIEEMRNRRSGVGEVTMGLVRSAVSFSTRWLVRQLPCVYNNIPASLFQVNDTQDRFTRQSHSSIGPCSLVSNWNHCSQQRPRLLRSQEALRLERPCGSARVASTISLVTLTSARWAQRFVTRSGHFPCLVSELSVDLHVGVSRSQGCMPEAASWVSRRVSPPKLAL